MWINDVKPTKLKKYEKEKILIQVSELLGRFPKLKNNVSRFEIKAGRLYLIYLVEKYGWDNPDIKITVPLIDGRYQEFYIARVVICDNKAQKCRLDWQSSDGKWIDLKLGTLEECFKFIEEDEWFNGII